MRLTVRLATLVVLLLSTACGESPMPTAPTPQPQPSPPVTTPRAPSEFPPVTGPARAFSDSRHPLYPPFQSRYVLYDDGSFEFQMNHPSATGGTYEVNGTLIEFRWTADPVRWSSRGELTGDTLAIFYSDWMHLADFVDGVYTRTN